MTWVQNYNPTGSVVASTLLAGLPVLVLLGLLGLARWSAARAAAVGLILALGVAIFAFRMPADAALAAAGNGAAFGLLPIGWIVLNAIFLYTLTVESGKFEIVRNSVAALSADRRIQALLIAFSFGAFLEGAAGFGTPVAITAAIMIGAGFPPLYAAGLALIANTAPVAFGGLAIPIVTLETVTGIDQHTLGMMAGRQLPFFSLIVPAWMILMMSGWRGLRGVWPAALVSGGSFAAFQFGISNFVGPQLVDVIGGLGSLVITALFLRVWQPRDHWHFAEENEPGHDLTAPAAATSRKNWVAPPRYTAWQLFSAWAPWVILSLFILCWGLASARPEVKDWLARWEPRIPVAHLHERVLRDVAMVAGSTEPEPAIYKFTWLSASGTAILLAAAVSAIWLRIGPRRFFGAYLRTLISVRWALFTIVLMLAIAFVTKYSGTDVTLGLAFTRTGLLYPFFAPLLGWLGVALTGSDTSSNALFGSLQKITAEKLGLNPILICASNSTGGVMGKMIDAQSIVVAGVATGQVNHESQILRFVFWHSLALAALMGLLTLAQATFLSWMVPT